MVEGDTLPRHGADHHQPPPFGARQPATPDAAPESCGSASLGRLVALWRAQEGDRSELNQGVVSLAQDRLRMLVRRLRQQPDAEVDIHLRGWLSVMHAAEAFLAMPELDRAFCEGLAWERVELLVRVTTRKHVAAWLAAARRLDLEALEQLVLQAQPGDPPALERTAAGGTRLTPARVQPTDAREQADGGEVSSDQGPMGSRAAPVRRERVRTGTARAWVRPCSPGTRRQRSDLPRRPDLRVRPGGARPVDAPNVRREPPIDVSTS